jgi:hypothetical protein
MVEPAEMPRHPAVPSVRVSDAEREAVVARLQAALTEGRLELQEFEERSAAAYAAKTEAELVPLTSDLPANVGMVPKTSADPTTAEVMSARRRQLLAGSEQAWVRTAIVLVVIWVIGLVVGYGIQGFWPLYPLGIWGAVLLARRLTGGRRY